MKYFTHLILLLMIALSVRQAWGNDGEMQALLQLYQKEPLALIKELPELSKAPTIEAMPAPRGWIRPGDAVELFQ